MAKYHGKVGFAVPQELRPGVWEDVLSERSYFGDIQRDNAKWREGAERLHKNIAVSNVISIVADAYAEEHIFAMRYIEWMGQFWTIADVVVSRPRIDIRLGDLYNGPFPA